MLRQRRLWLAVAAVVVGVSGCATGDEWATWRQHPSHFASGDHLSFSMRNSGSTAKVTRTDISKARDEGWWGKPITVSQEQILER